MSAVKILSGVLSSGQDVSGMTFEVTTPAIKVSQNINGEMYRYLIRVDTSKNNDVSVRRTSARLFIKRMSDMESCDAVVASSDPNTPAVIQKIEKTDAELLSEIREKFETLKLLSEAATNGKIRSMIVSGSPGTGKTHEVMAAIGRAQATNPTFYSGVIKGTISPVALYIELYNAKDGILVLDDSDSAFEDNEALQLLKAATESSKNRLISYRKLSSALEQAGIPNQFVFKGCVIILTNTDLEDGNRRAKAPHYDALVSRAHYINAVLKTNREKILRILSVIEDSDILDNILPNKMHHKEVTAFIVEHQVKFRELSIRTIVKLAELRGAFDSWEIIAKTTLLKG